jgi:hypothetical protein
MQFDEWNQEGFDEWAAPMDLSLPNGPVPNAFSAAAMASTAAPPGAFPEVEIGSSSDEDAPPQPPSTQLARENLRLRSRVNDLVTQSKTLEQTNDSLKRQLSKYRHSFASKIKHLFK